MASHRSKAIVSSVKGGGEKAKGQGRRGSGTGYDSFCLGQKARTQWGGTPTRGGRGMIKKKKRRRLLEKKTRGDRPR